MDKMREEFEAWAKGAGYLVLKEDDGEYSFQHMRHAWEAWKASRAALCVELPKTPGFSASDEPDLAFEWGVDVMKDLIESEGVTCK